MGKKTKIKALKRKIDKPFGDGSLSNAAFFGMIRSALRNKSRFFPSIKACRERAKHPYKGENKRQKWVYECEMCHKLKDAKSTCVHHLEGAGALSSFEDLPGFTERLFCNSDKLILLCNDCHDIIHGKNQ